ncbi:hypothetical protein N9K06_00625 [Omnitrophica bacterium]|nr:hypothetical protein [Candidatus Omnitrophota bacterium]
MLKPKEMEIKMNVLEIKNRRQTAPNAKAVSRSILNQFALWLRAGVGLGVMLFMAFTTLGALGHGADWIQGAGKPGRSWNQGQGHGLVIAKAYGPPAQVSRPAKDPRIIREQNRFVSDLLGHLSRTVGRIAH